MNNNIENYSGRLLRLEEALRRIPVSKSTWYAGIKMGRYPTAVYLGRRIPVWREIDIQKLERDGVWNEGWDHAA